MSEQPTTSVSLRSELGWGTLALPHLGPLHLAWTARGIVWAEQLSPEPDLASRHRWAPELRDVPPSAVPARFGDALSAFDRGEPIDPATLEVELRGTEFQNRVWTALRLVARGTVCTYGELAIASGSPRATRAVGMAMNRNPIPIVVPCHRVIAHAARIGGYAGGLDRKRVLLALEGVASDAAHVWRSQLSLL